MKRLLTICVVTGCLVFAVFPNTAIASDRTITFTNAEGEGAANDLHIIFQQSTTITGKGTFGSNRVGSNDQIHNLWGGTVNGGASTTIIMTTSKKNLKISSWWWTTGGDSENDGDRLGDKHTDNKTSNMIFTGDTATGDGEVLVNINDTDHLFATIAGYTATQTASAFDAFVDGIVDGAFALIHHDLTTPNTVFIAGNLLGDPTTNLKVSLVTPDSTQGREIVEIPEPATMMLLGLGSLIFRKRQS